MITAEAQTDPPPPELTTAAKRTELPLQIEYAECATRTEQESEEPPAATQNETPRTPYKRHLEGAVQMEEQ